MLRAAWDWTAKMTQYMSAWLGNSNQAFCEDEEVEGFMDRSHHADPYRSPRRGRRDKNEEPRPTLAQLAVTVDKAPPGVYGGGDPILRPAPVDHGRPPWTSHESSRQHPVRSSEPPYQSRPQADDPNVWAGNPNDETDAIEVIGPSPKLSRSHDNGDNTGRMRTATGAENTPAVSFGGQSIATETSISIENPSDTVEGQTERKMRRLKRMGWWRRLVIVLKDDKMSNADEDTKRKFRSNSLGKNDSPRLKTILNVFFISAGVLLLLAVIVLIVYTDPEFNESMKALTVFIAGRRRGIW